MMSTPLEQLRRDLQAKQEQIQEVEELKSQKDETFLELTIQNLQVKEKAKALKKLQAFEHEVCPTNGWNSVDKTRTRTKRNKKHSPSFRPHP